VNGVLDTDTTTTTTATTTNNGFLFFLEEKGGGWREGGVCYVLFMTQSIANNSIAVNMM
jgi:hypothetical protein